MRQTLKLLKLPKKKFGGITSMIKDWPLYFKDRLIISNLSSNVGVATLWMPKENVASVIGEDNFAVCGQLYTKRGINPLLRNCLANPNIRYIVVCGVDRQGSGEALIKFFKNGVEPESGSDGDVKGWKIIGDDEALIDKEIPLQALENVRKNVQVIDLIMKPLDEVLKEIKTLKKLEPYGEGETFDEAVPLAVNQYPTDMSVFKIRRDYIGDAWIDALKIVNKFGENIPGMYGGVKEVHNLSIVIEKEDPKNPKIDEFLNFSSSGLEKYIKGFFDKQKGTEAYTYGERIFDWDGIDQGDIMLNKLKGFAYDRGAMVVLWKPHVDNFPPKNTKKQKDKQTKGWRVPCLVMILGQCIKDNFNMTAVFRNNDIYGAWPLNAFALRLFQQNIAKSIGKNLGSLTTISHIAEIYEIDWDDSAKIVVENDSLDRTCITDTRGYYLVDVIEEDIVLTFFNPDGSLELAKFTENGHKPKVARDLCALAIKEMLISDLGSACDLGRQLAKAETAIKRNMTFIQDKVLEHKSS